MFSVGTKKKTQSWELVRRCGWIWEELRGRAGSEYDQITLYNIFEELPNY